MLFMSFMVMALVTPAPAAGQSPPAVPDANPGRPTVSTPATLTPVGYLQLENGVLTATSFGDSSSQVAANQVTKLAVNRRLQLLALFQPVVRSTAHGQSTVNAGGVALGAQAVLVPGQGSRPTISASYLHSVFGGHAPDLDIGSATDSGIILLSTDAASFHVDVNAIFNRQADGDQHRTQFGQTLSVAHGLGPLTLAVELWHFSQPFDGGRCAGLLVALSHPVRNYLIVDGGFQRGLTSSSVRWEFFGGFTLLVPHRLWK